jgi:hypothetical protein
MFLLLELSVTLDQTFQAIPLLSHCSQPLLHHSLSQWNVMQLKSVDPTSSLASYPSLVYFHLFFGF